MRLFFLIVLTVCTVLTIEVINAQPVSADTFLRNGVTAHRGNSSEFPENTMPAFRSGIEVGADWLELDILLSKDGKLVVIHDKTTKRVGDKNLTIAESTYAELKTVDVATDFRKQHRKTIQQCPPQTMPLLKEVLKLVQQQNHTRVSIQPKSNCVKQAIALVKQMQAERGVGFNDGNLNYMSQVKQLAPGIPVFWDRGANTKINDDIRIAKQRGFESLVIHYQGITTEKVRKIKAANLEVGAWTVNDLSLMKQLLKQGVERIYTDEPRQLLKLKHQ